MKIVISLLTILGFAFGAYLFLDARFAKCAEVKVIERRLSYKIENDKLMGMQQRIWQLEEKYPDPGKSPAPVVQQIKEINAALDMQKAKVRAMEAKEE